MNMSRQDLVQASPRVSASLYIETRAWLLANDQDAKRMLDWSNLRRGLPQSPEKLAEEIIWIILCAGRSAQAARTLEKRVWQAIHQHRPVVEAFGYRAKAAAIERAWREREQDFEQVKRIGTENGQQLLQWCASIPFIGDDTQFQLAKNLGADVCKPDIWLSRLAGFPDKPRRSVKVRFPVCMQLCQQLSAASGDTIAAVDSLLWLACNKGVLQVSPQAGEVTFRARAVTAAPVIPD